jgi:hypothetical protein
MDQLDTGALAVDAAGVIEAVNRPARDYLALEGDLRGRPLDEALQSHGLQEVGRAAAALAESQERAWTDVEVRIAQRGHRLRITVHGLTGSEGAAFGRVILIREISHEPLQRRFDDLLGDVTACVGELRGRLEQAREALLALAAEAEASRIDSPGMDELIERISRTRTAIENWLDVDDALAREDFPDAQLLLDRMRVATSRWPLPDELPERVRTLARSVEEYYESGENPKQHVL